MTGVLEQVTAEQPTQEVQGEGGVDIQPLLRQAIELLYGEHFESLVSMFQGGEESFPNAMGMAISKVLKRVEADNGELELETVVQLGGEIFQMLVEDLVSGGVIETVTPEMALGAIQQVMAMWLRDNQDRIDPNETGMSLQELATAMKEGEVLDDQPLGPEDAVAEEQPGAVEEVL